MDDALMAEFLMVAVPLVRKVPPPIEEKPVGRKPERIQQIAQARGMDADEILQNIVICRVYNSDHLEAIVRTLGKHIEKFRAKLVVVDSIISLHRAEFIGRATLVERQQRLNSLIHRLMRQAEVYNVAVVVSNQVQAQPDALLGDPIRPTGGNVIAHACTYRIYLKKAGPERVAIIVDSPCHPYSEARFRITEKGVEDPDGPARRGGGEERTSL